VRGRRPGAGGGRARAGRGGVRSLALRSKEAAARTEALIRESVEQTAEGEATTRDVSERLERIATAVGQASAVVVEIAATTRKQAESIAEVNRAVGRADAVTQQNATSAEQSAAAAELNGQAAELSDLLTGFRLSATGAPGSGKMPALPDNACRSPAQRPAPAAPSSPSSPAPSPPRR
jgi:methyl-accepting chemotaxis protein